MKPGTFTQLYVQIVFAVYQRECLLHKNQRDELFRYISGIIENKKCKNIITNGFSDHVHMFVGLNPVVSISDLVHDIKVSSSTFVNNQKWFRGTFRWQDGYGAFTYGKSQIDAVYHYILDQEKHHQKRPFREEYLEMLNKFDIKYDDRYLFEFYENKG